MDEGFPIWFYAWTPPLMQTSWVKVCKLTWRWRRWSLVVGSQAKGNHDQRN